MDVKSECIKLINNNLTIDSSRLFAGESWKELNIDSLSTYDIIVSVEEKFNLRISDQELKNINTPIELVKLIESKIEGKKL
jgi:acyl carrier protein